MSGGICPVLALVPHAHVEVGRVAFFGLTNVACHRRPSVLRRQAQPTDMGRDSNFVKLDFNFKLRHYPKKSSACFRSGRGIACRGAVVWTQFYSKSAYREAWCPIRRSPDQRLAGAFYRPRDRWLNSVALYMGRALSPRRQVCKTLG